MLNLLLFVLISFGFTTIIVNGSIFDKIRPNWKLFHCCMCMGFHTGYVVFLLFWFSGIKLFPNVYIGSFLFACLSSGASYILDTLFDDDGIKFKKTIK